MLRGLCTAAPAADAVRQRCKTKAVHHRVHKRHDVTDNALQRQRTICPQLRAPESGVMMSNRDVMVWATGSHSYKFRHPGRVGALSPKRRAQQLQVVSARAGATADLIPPAGHIASGVDTVVWLWPANLLELSCLPATTAHRFYPNSQLQWEREQARVPALALVLAGMEASWECWNGARCLKPLLPQRTWLTEFKMP